MSQPEPPTEDFLSVDPPIRGQNYVCLSFISPENIIKSKDTFVLHSFLKEFLKDYTESCDTLIDKFEDFKYKNEKTLHDTFNEENDFKTNVRGVKVRGVYDIKKEAEYRAKLLQNQDKNHNVFVAEVGYWLPWDPSSSYIDDISGEYLNKDLNTLMKKYQENQDDKNLHFEEMVKEKTKSATESVSNISESINEKEDPWLNKINSEKKDNDTSVQVDTDNSVSDTPQ